MFTVRISKCKAVEPQEGFALWLLGGFSTSQFSEAGSFSCILTPPRFALNSRPRRGTRILLYSLRQRNGCARALGPIRPSSTISETNHPAYLETIFRFGVLQLWLHRFERLHLEVVASKVGYLNILQDCICAYSYFKPK
jgi:hypothetical protein